MSPLNVAIACYALVLTAFLRDTFAAELPPLVPAVHSFTASGDGTSFQLSKVVHIVVDGNHAQDVDQSGLTLVPPTLLAFAQTFKADFEELFPQTNILLSVGDAQKAGFADGNLITMTLSELANATLADGSPTAEGYELRVSDSGIQITASGTKGAFWASRTLLQGLVMTGGRFPSGVVVDQPDWATRGFMLDVGRQWYPIGFLQELCTYASWFKISEFHVHLSDNVSPQLGDGNASTTYARFRLRPEDDALAGLTPHLNETYSREDFEAFQTHCTARGVTIVPELESPDHALVITQWKPELALSSDPTLINLTVPDAIPTIKAIWKEFLPWMHSKQVSIGADEYDSALADDYNNFVNEMSTFVMEESGNTKSIRIWGTKEPSNKTSVSKNITIQHWEFDQDDPFRLITAGYNVINSDDFFQYIVMKQSGSYPQMLNQTRLWEGANIVTGGIWDPHVFDRGNATNNPGLTDPALKGSIMAAWNDHGPTASLFLEAFYAVRDGLPVVASAAWQSAARANHLTRAQYLSGFPTLAARAPAQNLARRIPSLGPLVLAYNRSLARPLPPPGARIADLSGNGYDAHVAPDGVALLTPLGSAGHNYTLRVRAALSGAPGVLLAGPDDALAVVARGGGGGGLTFAFNSSNVLYPLANFTLPVTAAATADGDTELTEIVLTGTDAGTSMVVDGVHAGDFVVAIDGTTVTVPLAFVGPISTLGGAGGVVEGIELRIAMESEN
ncbi:glycoside hydrolase [Epithele typhae]|uniref:glycoside hydrolase n=1 Tax=Epithele typhae TaxID=378194 RepID=UPI0020073BFC|nr:glycoside hydrolase [Epithele typhae]KAH9944197.1 glycoside hydrolase [Epithele typhae]